MNFLRKRFVTDARMVKEMSSIEGQLSTLYSKMIEQKVIFENEIREHDVRINTLEKSAPKVVLYKSHNEEIEYSTTGAILDLLIKNIGKKLHYSDIYDMIKDYNLINKDVSLLSVKAILYGLARQDKISLHNGNKKGIFFIKRKKDI